MKYRTPNYESLKKLSLDNFLVIVANLDKVSIRKSNWVNLIEANKLICPVTNLKVAYVSYDKSTFRKGCSYHYNFYSECGKLFTIDHILPISKGGKKMDINNIQPMVAKYNFIKDDKLDYNYENNKKPSAIN